MKKIFLVLSLMVLLVTAGYAEELKPSDKPILGIITIVDIEPGAKFDAKRVRQKKYTFEQFVDEFQVTEPFKQAIFSKYMSRSITIESNNDALTHYFKDEYFKNPQLSELTFSIGANKYNYNYLFVNVLKFNRIERITGSAFFTLSMQMYWQIDAVSNYYLYDAKSGKLIFADSIIEKAESQFPAGSLLYHVSESAEEDALRSILEKISRSIINKESRKLPALE